ncbi:MAG: CHAT domain-containing protein [Planctomycetes bacterium]|nr:CHAT domain-containing protein [Planctomycetota bacterium]
MIRTLIWEPLASNMSDVSTIVIAPDGPLHSISFGALPGKRHESYLIEEYGFARVPSPAELQYLLSTSWTDAVPAKNVLVVGGIDYDNHGIDESKTKNRFRTRGLRQSNSDNMNFSPLPGTEGEIWTIKHKYETNFGKDGFTLFTNAHASEEAFCTQAPNHLYLHLATHGYFAPPVLRTRWDKMKRAYSEAFGDSHEIHPGLESAVVFAGVNLIHNSNSSTGDGVLTAWEASLLDLRRTAFVVLSACETGIGEDLSSIQRAFHVAGARTIVASLWKVSDSATRDLMERLYDNLWNKEMGKLEALREAQLWMLRERGSRGLTDLDQDKEIKRLPPFYWAAFVLSGDWR